MEYRKERIEIVKISKKLHRLGLVSLRSGNISLRVNNHILITPKGKLYTRLKPNDIVLIDIDGNILEKNKFPSTEYKLHLNIYKLRDNINAVIHTHSIFACILASLNIEIPVMFEEQEMFLGEVSVVSYASSGSEELANKVANALHNRKAVLIEKHGAVTVGSCLTEAFQLAELLERVCKIFYFISLYRNYLSR